jgi:BASS family bile acid:Na+ symporter
LYDGFEFDGVKVFVECLGGIPPVETSNGRVRIYKPARRTCLLDGSEADWMNWVVRSGSRLHGLLDQHLLMVLLGVGLGAYFLPPGPAFDSLVSSKPMLPWVFALAMLAIGSILPADELQQTLSAWPSVGLGVLAQYGIMPLLAFVLATLLPLDESMRVGVILCGCVPGAMASNVVTMMARGNVSYSVSMTTVATLLSPVVVPIAFALFLGASFEVDPIDTSWKLIWQVVLPVVIGFGLSRLSSTYASAMGAWGPVLANAAILWIVGLVVAENRAFLVQSPPAVFLALVLLNLLGYAGGYGVGIAAQLDPAKLRALSLEVGMQNAGLGASLASQLFPEQSSIAVPPAIYTFGCVFSGTILAWFWSQTSQRPLSNFRGRN